jgi:hypothetical protein
LGVKGSGGLNVAATQYQQVQVHSGSFCLGWFRLTFYLKRAQDADVADTVQDSISNNALVDVYSRYAPGVFPLGFTIPLFGGTGLLPQGDGLPCWVMVYLLLAFSRLWGLLSLVLGYAGTGLPALTDHYPDTGDFAVTTGMWLGEWLRDKILIATNSG